MDLQETVITNQIEFTKAVKNIEDATGRADRILANVEHGRGLVGKLMLNEEIATSVSTMLSNFMVLSSNVNNKGLWGVIRKPKKD